MNWELGVRGGSMEKLIISKEGAVLDEITLEKRTTAIGRDPASDVCLSDASVSRHHARLVKMLNEYFIEDLGSTNGTRINERPVTKHIVKSGDGISVGLFLLRFIDEARVRSEEDDLDKTVILNPERGRGTGARKPDVPPRVSPKIATVRYLRGPRSGRSEEISRSLYTIGKPGGEIAAIARRPQGFFLLHIGGGYPMINDREIDSTAGVKLEDGDVVQVGEDLAEIHFG